MDNIDERLKRGEMVVVGNKLMAICKHCRKLIRVDKPLLGSYHICVLPEERT